LSCSVVYFQAIYIAIYIEAAGSGGTEWSAIGLSGEIHSIHVFPFATASKQKQAALYVWQTHKGIAMAMAKYSLEWRLYSIVKTGKQTASKF